MTTIRDVPLVFFGPGIEPGTVAGVAAPVDIAPTLARELGISAPPGTGWLAPFTPEGGVFGELQALNPSRARSVQSGPRSRRSTVYEKRRSGVSNLQCRYSPGRR